MLNWIEETIAITQIIGYYDKMFWKSHKTREKKRRFSSYTDHTDLKGRFYDNACDIPFYVCSSKTMKRKFTFN